MSDSLQRLAKHTSIYSLGNIALKAGGFVLLPLYMNYLTVAEYGVLELLNSISAVVTSFVGSGLAHATLRFYFEYEKVQDRNAVVTTALLTSFIISVPVLLFLSLFNDRLAMSILDDANYVIALELVYATLTFEIARQIGLAYLRAREYSLVYIAICCIQMVVQVACNVVTVSICRLGVTGVLLGNGISVLCGAMCITVIVIRDCGFSYDAKKLKEMLKYSYPFLVSSVLGVFLKNADRLILKSLLSLEAVGIYALAQRLGMLITELVLEPFQKSFGAYRFSIMQEKGAPEIQALTLKYLIIITSIAAMGISFVSKEVLVLMGKKEYWDAAHYAPYICLSIVISSCGYVFQTGILYAKKTNYIPIITITSGLFGLMSGFALIKYFGIVGACFSLILQSSFNIILMNLISQKFYHVTYDYVRVGQIFAVAVFFLTLSLVEWGGLPIVALVIKLAVMASFPVVLYLLSVFDEYELEVGSRLCQGILKKVHIRS